MLKINSDIVLSLTLTAVLAVIGYFLMETCNSIKGLEKDVVTIREKITALESKRITRNDIKEMIADYHASHPCIIGGQKK